jgi:hypothetical protein
MARDVSQSVDVSVVVPCRDRLIARHAFKAVNTVWTDGNAEQRRRVTRSAWPHLTPARRAMLLPFRPWPGLYRVLNLLRRRLLGIRVAKS